MLSREKKARKKLSLPIVLKMAAGAAIAPLLVSLVVGASTLIRLRSEAHAAALSKAELMSTKLGSLAEATSYDELWNVFEEINKTPHMRVDMCSKDGMSMFKPLTKINACKDVSKGNHHKPMWNKDGWALAFADAKMSGKDVYLAVAVMPFKPKQISLAIFEFGLPALLTVLAVALFGATLGFVHRDYFAFVTDRLRYIAEAAVSPETQASAIRHMASSSRLESAVLAIEEKFFSELAIYRDAADEIQTLDARHTAFLSDLSSDLHTPLIRIIDLVASLTSAEAGPIQETQKEDLRIVGTAAKRLLHIVEEVLDLSSLNHTGIVYDKDPIDLNELAKEIIETARGGLGKKKVKLSLQTETDVDPMVCGSRQRLWQILTNLVGNAVKFTDEGEVTVAFNKTNSGRISMEIKDTGVGMSRDDLGAIFKPFGQRGALSKRLGGTGLGLATCKRLVELHGGEIRVKSKEREGSCFSVILPKAS